MNARLEELGLSFTIESMADLITHSRHEDLEFFWNGEYWTIRWWHDPDQDEEEEWGCVITGDNIRQVLEEAVYGMHFS